MESRGNTVRNGLLTSLFLSASLITPWSKPWGFGKPGWPPGAGGALNSRFPEHRSLCVQSAAGYMLQ